MALKLFILGLPGSGKSTIARRITAYLKDRNWRSVHYSDHVILKEMFLAESEHKQFAPADHGGFDVLDLTARDVALQKLEQKVNQHPLPVKQEEIVLIEFARNDYLRAFQQFSDRFLHDAYFLYLDVETDICKRRIQKRIANPISDDDFYVSEYIFNAYYNEDDGRSIPQMLASEYGIEEQRVKVINNNGSLSDSITQVNQFVDTMCGLEPLLDS
jgi:adenylate kinase family enzyme